MAEAAEKMVKTGLGYAVTSLLEYDTPKIVHIRNKKIGVINRIIQIGIIAYIGLYVLFWNKGYQVTDTAVSAVVTKLKGVAYTNFTNLTADLNHRVFDVADYVIPPQENDAFFVMTNLIYTSRQTQGTCDEDPMMSNVLCENDTQCHANEAVVNGNGVKTGRCIKSTHNPSVKVCEIYAWCPVEIDQIPMQNQAVLADSKTFTVLIKNHVQFVKFGVKRRNILDTQNSSYLSTCHYNADDDIDRLCPVFRLSSIVNNETADQDYDSMALLGGIMAVNIDWNCNLDENINNCKPVYSFLRLDNKDDQIAKGWNFRFANYFHENGTLYRDLIKAYGIRFVVKVTGKAGKFNIVPLLLNVGSGLGLLALSTIVCDIIVLYILKKGQFYQTKKYLLVQTPDPAEPQEPSDEDQVLHEEANLLTDRT